MPDLYARALQHPGHAVGDRRRRGSPSARRICSRQAGGGILFVDEPGGALPPPAEEPCVRRGARRAAEGAARLVHRRGSAAADRRARIRRDPPRAAVAARADAARAAPARGGHPGDRGDAARAATWRRGSVRRANFRPRRSISCATSPGRATSRSCSRWCGAAALTALHDEIGVEDVERGLLARGPTVRRPSPGCRSICRCARRAKPSSARTSSTTLRARVDQPARREERPRAHAPLPQAEAARARADEEGRVARASAPARGASAGAKELESAASQGARVVKIVILGAGQVGSTLAESLVSEQNDITSSTTTRRG